MISSRIAIVALNNHKVDKHYKDFKELSALKKIQRLEQRIIELCEQLKKIEPTSMWIIVWREYGIFSSNYKNNKYSRSVSTIVKSMFKIAIKNLTLKYPNLTIIAGTLPTRKIEQSLEQLNVIASYYKDYHWIKNEEKNRGYSNQFEQEENKIDIAKQRSGYVIIRNVCYIANNGQIAVRDKVAPFQETELSFSQLISVFQPGSKKNIASIFEVMHPTTNHPITFGIEICRENVFSVLSKISPEKPLIHFLLSDYLTPNLQNLHGVYALQMDSKLIPKLLYLGKEDDKTSKSVSIVLYQNNLLNPNAHALTGAEECIYPFEKKVVDILDNFLEQHANRCLDILKIKNKFITQSKQCHEKNSYDILYQLLINWKQNKINEEGTLSKAENELYRKLFMLGANEKLNHPFQKDYLIKPEKERPIISSGSKTENPYRHVDEPPAKKRRLNPAHKNSSSRTSANFFSLSKNQMDVMFDVFNTPRKKCCY